MLEKVLIILRGIPGCGKTSFAEQIGDFICTADDYHMKDGMYDWKPENVKASHQACQDKVVWGMESDMKEIIVANTSTTVKEMKVYNDLAEKYGYEVYSIIVENRHGGVNTHDVPKETLEKMKNRFDIQL